MADLDRQRPAPHARPLSHIRVYRKRARPLCEKWQKEYMRESLTECQLAKREELDPAKTRLRKRVSVR
jgi:hypothetical protein